LEQRFAVGGKGEGRGEQDEEKRGAGWERKHRT
jgi:hypothetical protein